MHDDSTALRACFRHILSLIKSSPLRSIKKRTHRALPGRPLPSLPAELWSLIIRYAAASTSALPHHLDTSQPVTFLTPPTPLHTRRSQYRSEMHQKLDLTLVSKSFSVHAQAVLYEDIWIHCAAQARSLALTLLGQACFLGSNQKENITAGRFIRRLHIETPSMERCCPLDLRTILDYAPSLVLYSDNRSVRRNLLQESSDPRCSPEQLFLSLTKSGSTLQRLVWTSYDDVSFYIHMNPIAQHLNHLELNFCWPQAWASVDRPTTSSSLSSAITVSSNSTTHTTVSTCFPTLRPGSTTESTPLAVLPTLTLPALRTLKVKLNNNMFMLLSTWDMPALQSLSVVSSDFSYASEGFAEFFHVHGEKITQLELGHSSASIEEHYYLTTPPPTHHGLHHSQQHAPLANRPTIPLAQWCPNLNQFICSADAEWNWQSPDWIAPHVLLPTHPTLQLIGIRDIDKRLCDDGSDSFGFGGAATNEETLFVLEEQIGSLLRTEAFPALQYVRDMSPRSDALRRGQITMGAPSSVDEARFEKRKVLDFWGRVLDRCKQRHVWLEDWQGLNVTSRDLKRAGLEW